MGTTCSMIFNGISHFETSTQNGQTIGKQCPKIINLFHLDFNPSCFVAWTVSPSSKSVYWPVLLQIYLQYHKLLLSYSETSLSIIHVTNKNPITTLCRRPATSYHHPGCGCSALRSPPCTTCACGIQAEVWLPALCPGGAGGGKMRYNMVQTMGFSSPAREISPLTLTMVIEPKGPQVRKNLNGRPRKRMNYRS